MAIQQTHHKGETLFSSEMYGKRMFQNIEALSSKWLEGLCNSKQTHICSRHRGNHRKTKIFLLLSGYEVCLYRCTKGIMRMTLKILLDEIN